jgi:hypothetical protein
MPRVIRPRSVSGEKSSSVKKFFFIIIYLNQEFPYQVADLFDNHIGLFFCQYQGGE